MYLQFPRVGVGWNNRRTLPRVKIEKRRRVRLKVKLQIENGEVLEESEVEYLHGTGKMLVGLEEELEGLEAGAKKSGVIPAEKAFGGAAHQHKKTIAKSEFPKDAAFEAGSTFIAGAEGQEIVIEVVSVTEDSIEALLRHPLADKNIAFEAEVLKVSDTAPPPLPSDAVSLEDDAEE